MINEKVLLELVEKWSNDSAHPESMDGSPESDISNARILGGLDGIGECSKILRCVIQLFGEKKYAAGGEYEKSINGLDK